MNRVLAFDTIIASFYRVGKIKFLKFTYKSLYLKE